MRSQLKVPWCFGTSTSNDTGNFVTIRGASRTFLHDGIASDAARIHEIGLLSSFCSRFDRRDLATKLVAGQLQSLLTANCSGPRRIHHWPLERRPGRYEDSPRLGGNCCAWYVNRRGSCLIDGNFRVCGRSRRRLDEMLAAEVYAGGIAECDIEKGVE